MGRVIRWTEYEDGVIRKVYPEGGYKAAQKLLPLRTKQGIEKRAATLGVSVKKRESERVATYFTPSARLECRRFREWRAAMPISGTFAPGLGMRVAA